MGGGNIDDPPIGQPHAVPALVRLPPANHGDPPRLNDDFCPFHLWSARNRCRLKQAALQCRAVCGVGLSGLIQRQQFQSSTERNPTAT
jgi:hypothetical protein